MSTKATIENVIFVQHSRGDVEGTAYDNVIISNGIEKIKLKNSVSSEILAKFEPEKDKVDLVCELRGKKEAPMLTLVSIKSVAK